MVNPTWPTTAASSSCPSITAVCLRSKPQPSPSLMRRNSCFMSTSMAAICTQQQQQAGGGSTRMGFGDCPKSLTLARGRAVFPTCNTHTHLGFNSVLKGVVCKTLLVVCPAYLEVTQLDEIVGLDCWQMIAGMPWRLTWTHQHVESNALSANYQPLQCFRFCQRLRLCTQHSSLLARYFRHVVRTWSGKGLLGS